mmetsp:Transcript_4673/g.11798  ORF Transcript_4673/g.11798 Transcript_4673/m.11798 type:complete len:590 (-) Transcript_4673:26-1795(-)
MYRGRSVIQAVPDRPARSTINLHARPGAWAGAGASPRAARLHVHAAAELVEALVEALGVAAEVLRLVVGHVVGHAARARRGVLVGVEEAALLLLVGVEGGLLLLEALLLLLEALEVVLLVDDHRHAAGRHGLHVLHGLGHREALGALLGLLRLDLVGDLQRLRLGQHLDLAVGHDELDDGLLLLFVDDDRLHALLLRLLLEHLHADLLLHLHGHAVVVDGLLHRAHGDGRAREDLRGPNLDHAAHLHAAAHGAAALHGGHVVDRPLGLGRHVVVLHVVVRGGDGAHLLSLGLGDQADPAVGHLELNHLVLDGRGRHEAAVLVQRHGHALLGDRHGALGNVLLLLLGRGVVGGRRRHGHALGGGPLGVVAREGLDLDLGHGGLLELLGERGVGEAVDDLAEAKVLELLGDAVGEVLDAAVEHLRLDEAHVGRHLGLDGGGAVEVHRGGRRRGGGLGLGEHVGVDGRLGLLLLHPWGLLDGVEDGGNGRGLLLHGRLRDGGLLLGEVLIGDRRDHGGRGRGSGLLDGGKGLLAGLVGLLGAREHREEALLLAGGRSARVAALLAEGLALVALLVNIGDTPAGLSGRHGGRV